MRLHRNASLHNGADFSFLGGTALQFHGIHPGFHEFAGVFERLFRGVEGMDGHVQNHESLFRGAGYAFAMMQHVCQGHMRGVWVAQHGHTQGIAHQNHIDAGFIQHAGGGVIVGCELGDSCFAHFCLNGGNLFTRIHGRNNQSG